MTHASTTFTESEVEAAALEWLENLGWRVAHGPNIAPHANRHGAKGLQFSGSGTSAAPTPWAA